MFASFGCFWLLLGHLKLFLSTFGTLLATFDQPLFAIFEVKSSTKVPKAVKQPTVANCWQK